MFNVQKFLKNAMYRTYDPIKAHEEFVKSRERFAHQTLGDLQHKEIDNQLTAIELVIEETINGDNPKILTEVDRTQLKHLSEQQTKEIDELNQKRKEELETISRELYHENLRLDSERYIALEALPKVPRGLGVIEMKRLQDERAEAIVTIKSDTQTAKDNLLHAADQAKTVSLRRHVIQKSAVVQKFAVETELIHKTAKVNLALELQHALEEADVEYEKVKQELARLLGRPT